MIEKLQVRSEHEIKKVLEEKSIKQKAKERLMNIDRTSTKVADLIKRIEILEELNGITQ